jgi:hypothetical protein
MTSIEPETFASLTLRQQDLLTTLKDRQKYAQVQSDRAESAERLVRYGVRDALDGGVPAKIVAAQMGLSVSRVYQIREQLSEALATG